MSNKTKKGVGRAAQYSVYKSSSHYSKNKHKKLTRHLKNNPDDNCAAQALQNIALYRRKSPKAVAWLPSDIKITSLFRQGGDKTEYRQLRDYQIEQVNAHKNETDKKSKYRPPEVKRQIKSDFFTIRTRLGL